MSTSSHQRFCHYTDLRTITEAHTDRLTQEDHVRYLVPSIRVKLSDQVFGDIAWAKLCTIL